MLAKALKGEIPFENCAFQPKINGNRCRAHIYSDHCILYSRQDNVINSVPHINVALVQNTGACVLDGELYKHGWSLEKIRSVVGRTINLHPEQEQIEYHVFDTISDTIQMERLEHLTFILAEHKHIKRVQTEYGAQDNLAKYLYKFLSQGYEGIIIRNLDAMYEKKKSSNLLKYKPTQAGTFKIIGFNEEVSIEGFPKQALGSLVCEAENGLKFRVGTGFTRNQRDSLWAGRRGLYKMRAKVKYQYLTDNGIPMHTVFIGLKEAQ